MNFGAFLKCLRIRKSFNQQSQLSVQDCLIAHRIPTYS